MVKIVNNNTKKNTRCQILKCYNKCKSQKRLKSEKDTFNQERDEHRKYVIQDKNNSKLQQITIIAQTKKLQNMYNILYKKV